MNENVWHKVTVAKKTIGYEPIPELGMPYYGRINGSTRNRLIIFIRSKVIPYVLVYNSKHQFFEELSLTECGRLEWISINAPEEELKRYPIEYDFETNEAK